MVVSVYLLGIALFVFAFSALRLSRSFANVTQISRQTIEVFRDRQLDDDAKERAARQASWRLLKQGVEILSKALLTVALAALPFWLADRLALSPMSETVAFASRWDVLGITTIAMIGAWLAWLAWRRLAAGRR